MNVSVIVVMGPAGAGKTTVGNALAQTLAWHFLDADDLHTQENIAKMRGGSPLTESDRTSWLEALRTQIAAHLAAEQPLVVACSALRHTYRAVLRVDNERVRFVYLKASRELLLERLATRLNHFMKAPMLESQLAALEEPSSALVLDAALAVPELVAQIERAYELTARQSPTK